MYNFKTI
jgi:nucleolar GTP-binding protein